MATKSTESAVHTSVELGNPNEDEKKKLKKEVQPNEDEKKKEIQSNEDEKKKEVPYTYNIDKHGWALIEHYIWDIGEDEEIEQLIDKSLRILLIHPDFDKLLWKNKKNIRKLYADGNFGAIVSKIHPILTEITTAMAIKIENPSFLDNARASYTNLKTAVTTGSVSDDSAKTCCCFSKEEEEKKKHLQQSQYAFWNSTVYKHLKDEFVLKTKANQAYFWSFLVSIACCIKYLEIEINAMAQFDIKKDQTKQEKKNQVIWEGFIVSPTHGTVGVNKVDDDNLKKTKSKDTYLSDYLPVAINRQKTRVVDKNEDKKCAGCFVPLAEIDWHKHDKPYCPHCVKFRVYQECVRKFVLEFDNEETVEDLWPWYENSKNSNNHKH
eukprot:181194_1